MNVAGGGDLLRPVREFGLFANEEFWRDYGSRVEAIAARHQVACTQIVAPGGEERVREAELSRIEVATFNGYWEADPRFTRHFFGVLLRAPRLRWFHAPNAGVDHPVFARLLERGVSLSTSAGANARPVAETALAGMLALARGFPHWWRGQQQRQWAPLREARRDFCGQTVVIVGLGAIGQELARLLVPFGVHLVGVRRSRQSSPLVAQTLCYEELDSVLPRADWLVLCCPLSERTRHLVDRRRLGLLPRHACVVNVSRGAVMDEQALAERLALGELAGAYLDVFAEEPLPPNSPLWTLPNVILSPHDAAGAQGNRRRVSELFLENLERFLSGQPLRNLVPPKQPRQRD